MANDGFRSRRYFLQSAGSLAGAAYLRLTGVSLIAITESACTARDESAAFKVLTADEAATLAAMAARIIPTTDTPGANEAGVIWFIDNTLGDIMRDRLDDVRSGLRSFNASVTEAHPERAFDSLTADEQDAFLTAHEDTDFFGLIRLLTIYGFFSMPKYGGNKDHVGWKLIGFEGHRGAWNYPFGHYDAERHTESADGE